MTAQGTRPDPHEKQPDKKTIHTSARLCTPHTLELGWGSAGSEALSEEQPAPWLAQGSQDAAGYEALLSR